MDPNILPCAERNTKDSGRIGISIDSNNHGNVVRNLPPDDQRTIGVRRLWVRRKLSAIKIHSHIRQVMDVPYGY